MLAKRSLLALGLLASIATQACGGSADSQDSSETAGAAESAPSESLEAIGSKILGTGGWELKENRNAIWSFTPERGKSSHGTFGVNPSRDFGAGGTWRVTDWKGAKFAWTGAEASPPTQWRSTPMLRLDYPADPAHNKKGGSELFLVSFKSDNVVLTVIGTDGFADRMYQHAQGGTIELVRDERRGR